jgi:hypothetical protein
MWCSVLLLVLAIGRNRRRYKPHTALHVTPHAFGAIAARCGLRIFLYECEWAGGEVILGHHVHSARRIIAYYVARAVRQDLAILHFLIREHIGQPVVELCRSFFSDPMRNSL